MERDFSFMRRGRFLIGGAGVWRTGRYTKGTNNITIRRLNTFKIKAGGTYSWAIKSLEDKTVVSQGTAQADDKGVLTRKGVAIPPKPSRLVVGE